MQNKGFVIFITAALAVICAYYLSFTPVVRHYEKEAAQITANGGDGRAYLDSMANEKVWLGHTLKKARTQQIGLGLDLMGGMNVVLRLNAKDLVNNLSGHNQDSQFQQALAAAVHSNKAGDFIDKFVAEYRQINPTGKLSPLFANGDMREQISPRTTDEEIIRELKGRYNSAAETSINVLRTRIDRFGVVSPNIQRIEGEGRILVELPGVKEPDRVRDLLQRSANLQFWRTYNREEVLEDLQNANMRLMSALPVEEVAQSSETAEGTAEVTDAEETASAEEAAADTTGTVAPTKESAQETSQKITGETTNSLLALINVYEGGGPVVGTARAANIQTIDSLIAIAHKQGYIREDLMLLWGHKPMNDPQTHKPTDRYQLFAVRGIPTEQPDLSGDVVTRASSDVGQEGIGNTGPRVSMSMNDEGSRKWATLTSQNVGRAIAIVLDGVVYSAPNVTEKITGGNSQISGNFTLEETADLANVLNSGKMDATVTIEQENVVGPTLGQASIRSGIISFFIALILLMIYMCLVYGIIPGLIADGALIVNSFFTLGVLASFHSVLTLSGIAGLVLTLGMAVDANVLIFERIKEELRAGKSKTRAISDGYSNAFSAIFDSNLTTIITGIVLYFFGTGPIRGFATTLIIGLIASFITAVFLTRIVAEALDKKGRMEKVTYTTGISKNWLVNPHFDILGKRKIGFAIPIIVIVLGIAGYFALGLNRGIEFTGGRNYIVQFDKPVQIPAVREALSGPFEKKVTITSIGTDGHQVRVSTNYLNNDETLSEDEINDKINDILFVGLNGFNETPVSRENFLSTSIISSQKVSASMSRDISQKAFVAVLLAIFFMALYILLRFRAFSYSLGVFASVITTTLSIIALYILLWRIMPFTMEVDQNFIAALLAIIGYSINDTVVVFDRVRETVKLYPKRDRKTVINDALNSTLSRTLNTSITTFLVMLIIFLFGGASMRSFTFAILLGVVIGTYCTLFVATPIAYMVYARRDKKATVA